MDGIVVEIPWHLVEEPKENPMHLLTRFICKRGIWPRALPVLILLSLTFLPLLASAQEDRCASTGIYIGNFTNLDIWYKLNDGPCHGWVHNSIRLNLKPGDALSLYSDLSCQTRYCPENLTYQSCLAFDTDRDCTVLVMPDCKIGDLQW
jgi:hypothetical protein